jgi:hypothetical protein
LQGAAAWRLTARAQPAERVRRIGVLVLDAGSQSQSASNLLALRDGLRSLGWTEERTLQLDVRKSDAKAIDAYADELVELVPDVIVTSSYLETRAVQQRTRSIPIVFTGVGDPTKGGLVKNLARPEGRLPSRWPVARGEMLGAAGKDELQRPDVKGTDEAAVILLAGEDDHNGQRSPGQRRETRGQSPSSQRGSSCRSQEPTVAGAQPDLCLPGGCSVDDLK